MYHTLPYSFMFVTVLPNQDNGVPCMLTSQSLSVFARLPLLLVAAEGNLLEAWETVQAA